MSHSQLHRVEACAYTCMAWPLRQAYDYWQDQPGTYHRWRARARRAPPARVRAPTRARAPPQPGLTPGPLALRRRERGLSPVQAAPGTSPHAPWAGLPMRGGPRGRSLASPLPARPQPWPGAGGFRRPGASPRASEERASGRAGGRAAHAVWRSLASPRPAPSSPGRTASRPPSGSHVRSAGASTRQAVARPSVLSGCVLWLGRRRATRRPQPARFPWDGRPRKDTSRLRGGHRSPHAPGPSRRDGAPAPGYGRPTAGRRLRLRAELAPWPPPEALPPCALHADPMRLPHTICSGTMRACENGGPPPLPFSGGE